MLSYPGIELRSASLAAISHTLHLVSLQILTDAPLTTRAESHPPHFCSLAHRPVSLEDLVTSVLTKAQLLVNSWPVAAL